MLPRFHSAAAIVLAIGAGAGLSDGAFVIDQIGSVAAYDFNIGSGPTPCQIFTDFPAFSCAVLEDFTVTPDQLEITEVSGLFRAQSGFVGFQQVDGYALNIFSDPLQASSGLAGNVASLFVLAGSGAVVTEVVDGGGSHQYGFVSLLVNVDLPAAGQYWLSLSPVCASSVSGQFLLMNSGASGGTAGNADARFANPGEGFGLGAVSSNTLDYAYSLTVVPEPSTAAIALLSGCMIAHRRKRSPHLLKKFRIR